ncbi:MAG: hypothetical protein ABSB42_23085 [Tepidisphaeraceae bacterium]|jgi:hypothetical protein
MAPARAVTTSHWVHENEADFKTGTLHDVVVTNQGDVKLSRAVKTIREQDANITTVNAIVQGPDGVIYAGTGPRGILLAVKDDNVSTAAKIDNTVNVLSLMVDSKGGIVLGTGGEKGRVLRLAKPGDKPTEIFSDPDVQYVWALQETADGNIYAATGPNGQVFEIKPDGSHSELYKSSEDNVTSMISDGKDLLYLGTDPDGLVIRLNRKTKEAFIVYNAGETEITALALDGAGNLYAATGQVSEHQTAQQPEAGERTAGRPEQPGSPAPIPSNPAPAPPQPPPIPNPNPGEPPPIPKGHGMRMSPADGPKLMAIMPVEGFASTVDGGNDPGGGGGDEPGPNAPGGPGQNPAAPQPAQTHPNVSANPPPSATEAQPQGPEGNAIYKIDAEGFVTEIFRQDAVIYSMFRQGDVLIVGTGDDGNVYQVNPATEETEVLAKVDAKQVMCLLPVKDGRIFMGLANTGSIATMTGGYASAGTYLSPVLDATQVSRFGKIQLHGQLPAGARLQVATRSGNVKDADSPGWSAWSAEVDAAEFLPIKSPSARFLQYRLTFSTSDPSQSAMVDRVDVAYQIPNMAPVIKSVRIGAGADTGQAEGGNGPAEANAGAPGAGGAGHAGENAPKTPGGTGTQAITWDASDPNNDALTYSLYFRRGRQAPWVLLKDGLTQASFEWDTHAVADGEYQVKVVASDALANPPGDGKTASRVSDYFVVDNTPPTIGDLDYKVAGGAVTISLRVQDQTSTVASVEYAVDSADQWQTVLPLDGIFDSPDEQVKFSVNGLTPGEHQVTIRATDSHGNQSLHSIVIKVKSATAGGQ